MMGGVLMIGYFFRNMVGRTRQVRQGWPHLLFLAGQILGLPHIFILMSGRWETTGQIYGPHSLSIPLLDVRQVKQEVTPLLFTVGQWVTW